MNYTKGGWKVCKERKNIWIQTREEGTGTIARIEHWMYPDEYEANARLISAAPQMYEALKEWQRESEGTRLHICEGCKTNFLAAIAKAEGKE